MRGGCPVAPCAARRMRHACLSGAAPSRPAGNGICPPLPLEPGTGDMGAMRIISGITGTGSELAPPPRLAINGGATGVGTANFSGCGRNAARGAGASCVSVAPTAGAAGAPVVAPEICRLRGAGKNPDAPPRRRAGSVRPRGGRFGRGPSGPFAPVR